MLWETGSLASQPQFDLGGWTVVETPDGDHHLIGIDLANGNGQVSSAIQSFDRATRRCVTASGRVYDLHPASGISTDNARYVWEAWRRHNDVETWTDVSEQYRGADCS